MNDSWPAFTAAAVQAAPVYLDREATVDKACALIRAAGSAGARLIAFPEVFVPGFPHWIYLDRPEPNERYFVELVRGAVDVPGPDTERLGRAARATGAYAWNHSKSQGIGFGTCSAPSGSWDVRGRSWRRSAEWSVPSQVEISRWPRRQPWLRG